MIAVDTNILVRVLTNDDPVQAERAAKIIRENDIYISKSVILETEWVLRYTYKIEKKIIIAAFEKVFGLPNVQIEDFKTVQQAILWHEYGLDFADALHLASSRTVGKFATFDIKFANKAKTVTEISIIQV